MKASVVYLLMIFGLSILTTTPAKSEIVHVTDSGNGEARIYVDKDSIIFDRNFAEASVIYNYKTPSSNEVSSAKKRWKVNCSDRNYMSTEINVYDLNGIFLRGNRQPSGWRTITPGAVNADIYYFICNLRR